jgi:hypothetical protein
MLPAGGLLLRPEHAPSEEETVRGRPWQRAAAPPVWETPIEKLQAGHVEEAAEVLTTCPRCGGETDAFSFCSHCGVDLPNGARRGANTGWQRAGRVAGAAVRSASPPASTAGTNDPAACALLSFFFPGLGQILNKQVAKGVFLILVAYVAVAYLGWSAFGMPMLIGRIVVAVDAHRIARRRRAGRPVEEWEWGLQEDKR